MSSDPIALSRFSEIQLHLNFTALNTLQDTEGSNVTGTPAPSEVGSARRTTIANEAINALASHSGHDSLSVLLLITHIWSMSD